MTDYTQDLLLHSNKLNELSEEYAKERKKFGTLEGDLMVILATKIDKYIAKKKNIGIEMALLQLVNEKQDLIETYNDYKESYHNYKALGKLIETQQSSIMAIQSIMKFNRSGEFTA